MDEDWLEAVLSQKPQNGTTWAVFRKGAFVAVAETAFSPQDLWLAAITALAIRPDLRGQGVGTAVPRELLQLCHREGRLEHIAYIKADNGAARGCFERVGFTPTNLEPDKQGYLMFRHHLKV